MTTEKFATKVLSLQTQVTSFLEEARALVLRAAVPLSRGSHYGNVAAQIDQELSKVRSLELRMTVVAPMKAGKSTIINAILGQALLPTRNSAMTSLPSEIVCDQTLHEPKLHIPPALYARFGDAWETLHRQIRKRGPERLANDVANYPEIMELVRSVASTRTMPLSAEIVGREQVCSALRDMNDLCRLATAIDPDLSPLTSATTLEVPRIETPFLRFAGKTTESIGRVIIVDTPGPNEARRHEALQSLISAELGRTSIVLIVLDFTQLNTQAAAIVGEEVRRVVSLVGDENLLVLVNKIDERLEDKGMQPEDVQQFVASHLHLRGAASRNRVFEVSAKQAFCAADFLRELGEMGTSPSDEAARALPRARELAMQAFGATDWQEELGEASVEKLARRAEKLWGISKFEPFLTEAFEAVMTGVAPRALSIALRVARSHLLTLRNDVSIRSKGLDETAKTLKDEIAALDDELAQLERARKAIARRVQQVRSDLREQLAATRRGLQRTTYLEVATAFRDARQGQETFAERLRRQGARFVHFLGLNWREAGPLPLTFTDPLQAEDFASEAVEHVLSRVRPQIERELCRVDQQMERTRSRLEADIEAESHPIVVHARERLKKRFEVRLEIPRPDLGNPLAAVTVPAELTQRIDGGYNEEVRWERKWYVLWLFKVPVRYRVKRGDSYVVSLEDVGKHVNDAINGELEQTASRFEAFLEGEFRRRVDDYFSHLVEYLTFYRQSIEQAQESQRLSLHEREKTRDDLHAVMVDANSALTYADELYETVLQHLRGGEHMMKPQTQELFFAYSHADGALRSDLEKHLATLKREGVIRAWHDRKIGAGEEWRGAIDAHLERASIVLLLISADFINSDYCYDVEAKRALERHEKGEARVIPVILRACDWKTTPFAKLQALPTDGRPITSWSNRDEAFTDVAQGIRDAVRKLTGAR